MTEPFECKFYRNLMNGKRFTKMDLLEIIHTYICNQSFMDNMSLLNGKVGLLLYHSLHSELLSDENERIICQNILREVLTQPNSIDSFDRRFIDGLMSLPYVISILTKLDVVDLDIDLGSIVLKCIKRNPGLNVTPSIILDDRDCLGEALSLVSVFPHDDSLLCYSIQESIITFIDHCDRLLNIDVPPIYYREEMSCQYLHSIFYFLECARRLNIYPTKVNRLLSDINQRTTFLKDKEKSVHSQILCQLQGKDMDFSNFHNLDPINKRIAPGWSPNAYYEPCFMFIHANKSWYGIA